MTPRERTALVLIAKRVEAGEPCTQRKLGRAMGLASTAGAYDYLMRLERAGYIRCLDAPPGLPRPVALTAKGRAATAPKPKPVTRSSWRTERFVTPKRSRGVQ